MDHNIQIIKKLEAENKILKAQNSLLELQNSKLVNRVGWLEEKIFNISMSEVNKDNKIDYDIKAFLILIEELNLQTRTKNLLRSADINNVGELISFSADDLMKIRNFGQNSLQDVVKALEKIEFRLAP